MRKPTVTRFWMYGLIGLMLGLLLQSPQSLADDRQKRIGKQLYENHCAVCHGRRGKGDGYTRLNPPPADLSSSSVVDKSDLQLIRIIHEGRPNTAMGAWKWVLSEEETKDVLAYVRTFSR